LFAHEIAKTARSVVGVDFSENALAIAEGDRLRNRSGKMEFRLGEAKSLPLADELFDLVISRRGPATANETTLSEVFRVLKGKGILMEITIGEENTRNLAEIFRRGQMYSETERVAVLKKKPLERAGFEDIQIEEYLATEIFPSIEQLILRLNDSPIIPGFDAKKDEHFLRLVVERCKTPRGIETPAHRVTIIARK
jgi:ubiquinone/menaquinone biosynthesis C-methylase UbiE